MVRKIWRSTLWSSRDQSPLCRAPSCFADEQTTQRTQVDHLSFGSWFFFYVRSKMASPLIRRWGSHPLTGVTMATRSGDVDVELVTYMMKKLNITDPEEMISILTRHSDF